MLFWQKVVEFDCNIKYKILQGVLPLMFLLVFVCLRLATTQIGPLSISLKEVQNCILCMIRAWSLFCSLRIFVSLCCTYSFKKLGSCFSGFFFFCRFRFELEVTFIHFCNYYLCRYLVLCDFVPNQSNCENI